MGERDRRVVTPRPQPPPPPRPNPLTVRITSLIKRTSRPPLYEVRVDHGDGASLVLRSAELRSLRAFQLKFFEAFNYIPNIGLKQADWERHLNEFRDKVELDEAPEDASEEGRRIALIREWLMNTPRAETPEEVDAGKPLERDGRIYFKAHTFLEHLRNRYHLVIQPQELWELVRRCGGDGGQRIPPIRVGNRVFRLWYIPRPEEDTADLQEPLTPQENDDDLGSTKSEDGQIGESPFN